MTEKPYQYRIVEHDALGFEPQILYISPGAKQEIWQPLNQEGYWADPEAYSYGNIRWRIIFTARQDAERAITRAKSINEENIRTVL